MESRLDERSALVLMDFQNDVVHAEGALGRLGGAALVSGPDGTLDRAARLLAGFRAAARVIVHVAVEFREGYPDADPGVPLSRMCVDLGCLLEGSWGAQFIEALAPRRGEPTVVKRGMSAFGGTDLDLLLRLADVRTIVLAGVASNLVVESTARQGVDLGYRVVVPRDASMGFSVAQHEEAVVVLSHFARIVTVHELLSELPARARRT